MKFGVVVFPGSNCEQDCFYVIKDLLGQPVEHIWHQDRKLDGFDCLVIPGGFSYGDYLRSGAIAGFSPVMEKVVEFSNKGGLIIGICNGFQILLEAGLLPGSMLRNKNIHFICKYSYVAVKNNKTPFTSLTRINQVLKIPIAHNEGNYYIDEKGLKDLRDNDQIVFQYCSVAGEVDGENNPNGAVLNIAGIINREGNVLGMMPHPERSSEKVLGSEDGLLIFNSIVSWLKGR